MCIRDRPQAGAADLFGMALIHPVKTFKDALLILRGDADTVVLHSKDRVTRLHIYGHLHPAGRFVILDRIVAEVKDHLIQDLGRTLYHRLSLIHI